jgi:outer membrane immunogenic protein
MKRLLASTILSAALLSPACAADLPVKAAPAPAAYAYDPWTGFYIGANAGYGWDLGTGAVAFQAVPLASLNDAPQGFVGGVQLGYGMHFQNIFYLGIEGDFDGAAVTGSASMPGLITTTSKNSYLASVRGEFGLTFGNMLVYGTGGWGFGGGEFTVDDLTGRSALTATTTRTMNGAVWGGGIKFAIAPNWIVGVKYLQYDFGDFTAAPIATPGIVFTQKDRVDVVRAELNYKF